MGLLGALGLSAGHMISTNGRRSPGIIKVEQEGYHFWFPLSLSLAFSVSISLSAHCEKWHPSLKQNTQSFKGVLKPKCLFSKEDEDRSLRSALCEGGNHPPTDQAFSLPMGNFPWGAKALPLGRALGIPWAASHPVWEGCFQKPVFSFRPCLF